MSLAVLLVRVAALMVVMQDINKESVEPTRMAPGIPLRALAIPDFEGRVVLNGRAPMLVQTTVLAARTGLARATERIQEKTVLNRGARSTAADRVNATLILYLEI
jgi:hypothetical protein